MKKTTQILIIITILILHFFLLKKDFKCKKEDVIIDTTHNVVQHSNIQPISQDKPSETKIDSIIYKKIYIHDTVEKLVFDTIEIERIVTQFLTKNKVIDTLQNDSLAKIILTDIIYRNAIEKRTADISIYSKKQKQKNEFFIGVGSMLHKEINLNLNVGFRHKKHIVIVGYGNNNTLLFNYEYKLK